jgi:hypothetical protein
MGDDLNVQYMQLLDQIKQVEQRIATNTAKLQSFDNDAANQIANLEMDKIGFRLGGRQGNSDPTSLWRWNVQRQDTERANNRVINNSKSKYANEVSALLKTSISPEYLEQKQQLSNVRNKIAEGQTLGADTSELEKLEKELQTRVDATYKNVETVKKVKSQMTNLDKQLSDGTIKPDQYTAEIRKLMNTQFDDDDLMNTLITKSKLGDKKADEATRAAILKSAKKIAADAGYDWEDLSKSAQDKFIKQAGG